MDLKPAISDLSAIVARSGTRERAAAQARQSRLQGEIGTIDRLLWLELREQLEPAFGQLTNAGEGELVFEVSSAGFRLSQLLAHEALGHVDLAAIESFSRESQSPALAAISWRSEVYGEGHCYLGIYVVVVGESYFLLRIPVMYRVRGETQDIVVRDILPGLIEKSASQFVGGGLTIAKRFAQETASMAAEMALKCISLIRGGTDPFDSESW